MMSVKFVDRSKVLAESEGERTLLKRIADESSNELGASLVEYAMLVALIALVALTGIQAVGNETRDKLCDSVVKMENNQMATGTNGYYNPEEDDCCLDMATNPNNPFSSGGSQSWCIGDSS